MAELGNIIGKVAVLQGHAYIQRPDGSRVELKIGDAIHEGDVIITGPGAVVELMFNDGHSYVVHQNETMMIDASVFSTQAVDAHDAAINAQTGQLDELNSVIASGQSLDQLFDSAAAGIAGDGKANSAHSFVQLLRIVESTNPGSFSLTGAADLSDVVLPSEVTRYGNGSAPEITITPFPTVNGAQANSASPIAITGTVSANVSVGNVVTITVDGHTYTGPVLPGGTYMINVPASVLAASSSDIISASVSIPTSNGGVATSTVTQIYNVELTAPPITIAIDHIPTVNGAQAASANPISVTGSVSSNVPVGNAVTLTIDGHAYTGTVQAGGIYSIAVPGNVLAGASIDNVHASISSMDAAGNTATATADRAYLVELTAPPISISINPIATVNGVEGSSSAPIAITGSVSANVPVGDTVTITVGGQSYTGIVQAGGTYSIGVPGIVLANASVDLIHATVSMTDTAGNTASASATESYSVELSAPPISITINAIATVNIAEASSESLINVSGTVSNNVPVGNAVTLTIDGHTFTGTVQAGSTYSIDVPGNILAGAAIDTIIATVSMTDAAGNTANATASENYAVDLSAPPTPEVAFTAANNGYISSAELGTPPTVNATITLNSDGQATLANGGFLQVTVDDNNVTQHLTLSLNAVGQLVDASNNVYAYSGGVITLTEAAPGNANAITITAVEIDVNGNASSGASTSAIEYTPASAPLTAIVGAVNGELSAAIIGATVNATVTLSATGQASLISGGSVQITVNDNGTTFNLDLHLNSAGALVDGFGNAYSYSDGVITLTEAAPGNGQTITVTATETDVTDTVSPSSTASALEYTPITSVPAVTIVNAVNGELNSATTGSTVNATVTLDAAGQASLLSNGAVQITVVDAGVTQNLNLHLNSAGILVDTSGNAYSYSGGVITLTEAAPGSGNAITVTATETDAAGLVSASAFATANEYTPVSATAPEVVIVGAVSNTLTNAILDGATTVNATVTLNTTQQSTLASGGSVQLTIVDAGVTQTLNLALSNGSLVDSLGHSYSYSGGVITVTEAVPGNGNILSVSATLTDAAGQTSPTGNANATEAITVPNTPIVALLANGLIGNYYGVTETQISAPPSGFTALEEVSAYLLTKAVATSTADPTTFPSAIIAPATAGFVATEINYGLNTTSTAPTTGNETITTNLGTSGNLSRWLGFTGATSPYASNFQTLSGYGTTTQSIVTLSGVVALPTLNSGQKYAIKIFADDGYQVYIDGQLVASIPINQSGRADYFYFTAPATAGSLHTIQILYWDQGGVSSIQASIATIATANVPANSATVPTLATPLAILTPAQTGEVTATVTLDNSNQTILANGGIVKITESNGTNLTLHQNSSGQMVDAGGLIYTYVNGVIYVPVATTSSTASISATVVDQYTYSSATAFTGPSITIISDTSHDGYLNAQEVAAETNSGHMVANVNLNTTMLSGSGSATITVVDAGVSTTLTVSSAGVITGTTTNVAATYSGGVVTISMANPGNGNSATISATQTDQYGHVSTTATSTIVENISAAPAAPTLTITTDTNHDGYLSASELNANASVNTAIILNNAAQTTLSNGGTVQIHVTDNSTTETLNLHLNSSGVLVNAAGVSSPEYSYTSGVISLTELAPGNGHSLSINATTTDIAGNVSAVSTTATAIQDVLTSPTVMTLTPQHATVSLDAAGQAVLATAGSTLMITASDGTNLTLHTNSGGQLVDASNTLHSYTNGTLPLTLNSSASAPVVNVTATLTDSHGVSSFTSSATLVNSGSNALTGLVGGDTFIFALGANGAPGTPHVETISAFNTNAASNGGDVLNLSDLLSLAPASATAAALTNYLHFTEASNGSGGHTTTVHVSSTGGYAGGYSAAQDNMQIVLTNADLLHSAGAQQTDAQIIQTLLNNHKLVEN